jgi:hypothetical protein
MDIPQFDEDDGCCCQKSAMSRKGTIKSILINQMPYNILVSRYERGS